MLQTLLPKHTNVPELYFLLMALFLQQPITELPDRLEVRASIPNLISSNSFTKTSRMTHISLTNECSFFVASAC